MAHLRIESRQLLSEIQEYLEQSFRTRVELNDSDREIGLKVGRREVLEFLHNLQEEDEDD